MWPFRRHTGRNSCLDGFIDWHCHILPGVDDGVRTMEEALEILSLYESLGASAVWFTPHVMEDIPNTTGGLKMRYAELQSAYKGKMRLHLAAEYMLDNLFEERLAAGDLLPLGENKDCLLVETSYFNPPIGFSDMLQRIKNQGYTPVLAHPERYLYMNRRDYLRLQAEGILFQSNVPSRTGFYGKHVRQRADWLRRKGLVWQTGTDLHDEYMLAELLKSKKLNIFLHP